MNIPLMRVMAFDVRPQRLGYIVFEDEIRLLDWDVMRSKDPVRLTNHIERLLSTFQPSVVVLRSIKVGSSRDRPSLRRLMRGIRSCIQAPGVSAVYIRTAAIKRVFDRYGKPTKERMAGLVAASFPELASWLPPHRLPWETEHWRMPLFDAAALALTYFASQIDMSGVHQKLQRSSFVGPSVA